MLHGPPGGANQTKTALDAHSTASRRQMAVRQSADQPSPEGCGGWPFGPGAPPGFYFSTLRGASAPGGVTNW
jgi:hypothetical protein